MSHRSFCMLLASVLGLAGCTEDHSLGVDGGRYVRPRDTGLFDGGPIGPMRDAGMRDAPTFGWNGDGRGDLWDGYVETHAFASGSRRLRIRFNSDGTSGIVVFGEAPAPPLATDANVGYPPGDWYRTTRWQEFIQEGAEYRFDGATNTSTRVEVAPRMAQIWTSWCALQIPVVVHMEPPNVEWIGIVPPFDPIETGDGTCAYTDRRNGDRVAIDCGRLALASPSPCQCTPSSCAPWSDGWAFHVYLEVSGNEATGALLGWAMAGGDQPIRMTRTPAP